MEIIIKDTLCSVDNTKIEASKRWFNVNIYLQGLDLPYVKIVRYTLHPELDELPKIVYKNVDNQNCKYSFWTWGTFIVNVEIEDYKGEIKNYQHKLEFVNELSEKQTILIKDKTHEP
jgi:hypothetical protein